MAEVDVRVCWLISLPRSGSSVTAYAAAAPWGHGVADEIFGPWDRTGEPYCYPAQQRDLARAFEASRATFTPEVIDLANEVFAALGERTGVVICKHPHGIVYPGDLARAFPGHRALYLICNPVRRLNSLFARGWQDALPPGSDVIRYRSLAALWQANPERAVALDLLLSDPRAYYRRVFEAWGWAFEPGHVESAAEYARTRYHAASVRTSDRPVDGFVADGPMVVPERVLERYFDDEQIVAFMRRMGWPDTIEAYTRADGERATGAEPPSRVGGGDGAGTAGSGAPP